MTGPNPAGTTAPVPDTAPAEPGERYVTVLGDERWPALVDLADRWNGWLSPLFRPDVARAIARWQTADVATDDEQDQLVLSPDQRTLVHLVPDDEPLQAILPPVDGQVHGDLAIDSSTWPARWLASREHSVWLVYQLDRPVTADDDGRVAIGAWHWCWYLADPDPDPDPAPTHETCRRCGEPQGSTNCRCGHVVE